jgi:hypothetical protein
VQRLAKFFTLTNAAITYPFVIFFLCTFWNVVFFCVVPQINVVTAAVQADNKLDLPSLAFKDDEQHIFGFFVISHL